MFLDQLGIARQGAESTMANSAMQVARMGRFGCAIAALVFGLASLLETAMAQQPTPKKAPAKQEAPLQGSQSAWVKLCEKVNAIKKEKDGKGDEKELNICVTTHQRLDGNNGMVVVSAALRQVEGQTKQEFMVMVPLGMQLQAGMRARFFPKDLWEKVQKREQVDENKLKQFNLSYTFCTPDGCTARTEATPDLLADLKSGGGFVALAINPSNEAVGFSVPLSGFEQAYAGDPTDPKQYAAMRRALMLQIAQRQHERMEAQQSASAPAASAKKK
jgi:invasion protein IalB